MSYVKIKIIKEAAKATPEFKDMLIAKVSDAVADVCVELFNTDRKKLLNHMALHNRGNSYGELGSTWSIVNA